MCRKVQLFETSRLQRCVLWTSMAINVHIYSSLYEIIKTISFIFVFQNRLYFCKWCGVYHNVGEKPLRLKSDIWIQYQFHHWFCDLSCAIKVSGSHFLIYDIGVILLAFLHNFYISNFLKSYYSHCCFVGNSTRNAWR